MLVEQKCGKMYTLRHTPFWGDISTHLSHLYHLSMGVAKSIVCATPIFAVWWGLSMKWKPFIESMLWRL